jgi:hypothetical protein
MTTSSKAAIDHAPAKFRASHYRCSPKEKDEVLQAVRADFEVDRAKEEKQRRWIDERPSSLAFACLRQLS